MNEKKIRDYLHNINLENFPFGVYLITAEGEFLECSKSIRELLGISYDDISGQNITDYYFDPLDRPKIIERVLKNEVVGHIPSRIIIPFRRGEEKIYLQNSCRSIRDENNVVIGFIGSLHDVTEEHTFQILSEKLKVAIFHLVNDKFRYCNEAFYALISNSSDTIIGKSILSFLHKEEDKKGLQQIILNKIDIQNNIYEFKKHNTTFMASITLVYDPDTKLHAGRISDYTEEWEYKQILELAPIGSFLYAIENNHHILKRCNDQYATMLNYVDKKEIIGKTINDIYEMTDKMKEYFEALEDNETLIDYPTTITSQAGSTFEAKLYVKKFSDGNLSGRVGAMIDVNKVYLLEKRVRELSDNVGKVLHSYSHTLRGFGDKINHIISTYDQNYFGKTEVLHEDVHYSLFELPIERLITLLIKLRDYIESTYLFEVNDGHDITLDKLTNKLQNYLKFKKSVDSLSLSFYAVTIRKNCKVKLRNNVSRELLKDIIRETDNIINIRVLQLIHYIRDKIIQLGPDVDAMRDFISSGIKEDEKIDKVNLRDLTNLALRDLELYYYNRNLEIRTDYCHEVPFVYMRKSESMRAISNVLHNAIKYSWVKGRNGRGWIDIRIYYEGNYFILEIVSWGVPIYEAEMKHVFKLGFRGMMSSDRNRIGTGIGLNDTKTILEKYGGTVKILSRIADPSEIDSHSKYYKTQPFITTVSLFFPISGRRNIYDN